MDSYTTTSKNNITFLTWSHKCQKTILSIMNFIKIAYQWSMKRLDNRLGGNWNRNLKKRAALPKLTLTVSMRAIYWLIRNVDNILKKCGNTIIKLSTGANKLRKRWKRRIPIIASNHYQNSDHHQTSRSKTGK